MLKQHQPPPQRHRTIGHHRPALKPDHDQTRLTTIQRKIEKIIEAVMDGFKSEEMKLQLDALSQQKAQLQARLAAPAAAVPSLHPNLAELYRSKVTMLHEELTTSNSNNTAVLEALRDLIERVDFDPGHHCEPEIILTGALASMVRLGLGDTRRPAPENHDLFSSSVKMVAGARFELTTFRL
jgi:site-specific DNA recombinase